MLLLRNTKQLMSLHNVIGIPDFNMTGHGKVTPDLFCSSLPPVVCRRAHVLFMLFVFVFYTSVQHILCCVLVGFFRLVASFTGLSIFDCHFGILYRLFIESTTTSTFLFFLPKK